MLCVARACALRMKKYLVYEQEAICQSGYELIRNALISRPTCNQILFLLYLHDNSQRYLRLVLFAFGSPSMSLDVDKINRLRRIIGFVTSV